MRECAICINVYIIYYTMCIVENTSEHVMFLEIKEIRSLNPFEHEIGNSNAGMLQ